MLDLSCGRWRVGRSLTQRKLIFLAAPLYIVGSVPNNSTTLEKISKSCVWDKLSFSFNLAENLLRLQSPLMQILFLITLIRF